MPSIDTILARYKATIAEAIVSSLGGDEVFEPIRYHYNIENNNPEQIPGKMIRPILTLLTYEGLSSSQHCDLTSILPAAVAVEHLHNFSLIHDDIEDHDRERHGRPTVWTIEKWQEKQAINAGDFLHTLAYEMLETVTCSEKTMLAIIKRFSQTSHRLIVGQYFDMTFEQRSQVTSAEYLAMISGKTGSLIEYSLLLGAILQESPLPFLQSLEEYGKLLGQIFQIRDDFLGIWGEHKTTGKSITSDIQRRKKTFPVIYALQKAWAQKDQPKAIQLIQFYEKKNKSNVEEIRQLLDYFQAKEATQSLIADYLAQALSKIKTMHISEQLHADLMTLTHFFASRDH